MLLSVLASVAAAIGEMTSVRTNQSVCVQNLMRRHVARGLTVVQCASHRMVAVPTQTRRNLMAVPLQIVKTVPRCLYAAKSVFSTAVTYPFLPARPHPDVVWLKSGHRAEMGKTVPYNRSVYPMERLIVVLEIETPVSWIRRATCG